MRIPSDARTDWCVEADAQLKRLGFEPMMDSWIAVPRLSGFRYIKTFAGHTMRTKGVTATANVYTNSLVDMVELEYSEEEFGHIPVAELRNRDKVVIGWSD